MKVNNTFMILKEFNTYDILELNLTLLYLPVIEKDSYSLYNLLLSLKNDFLYSYSFLLDVLKVRLEEIKVSIKKLEAYGLIKTYESNSEILYRLNEPLGIKDFFNNPILYDSLSNALDDKEIDIIKSHFNYSNVDLTKYNDITNSFDNVFEKTIPTSKIKLSKNIDFGALEQNLKYKINPKMFVDEKFIEAVNTVSYIYNFTLEELIIILDQSLYKNGNLNYYDFRYNSLSYYNKHKDQELLLKYKDDKNNEPSINSFEFDSLEPLNFIWYLTKRQPDEEIVSLVEKLLVSTSNHYGITNVLIYFILSVNNNVIPHYNYFKKVLQAWDSMGIASTTDAINYVTRNKDNSKKEYGPKKIYVNNNKKISNYEEPDYLVKSIEEFLKNGNK
ncbi:MAG: hypothetical protein LBV51_03540 [Acholeplasmatales bacterium]|jgi:replication initiation and membrane attachment protein DnaB|nr:hypothetical protein [Acholeplasmatales bacterium]